MNRRRSLQLIAGAAGGLLLMRCGGRGRTFPVKVSGASADHGHRMRDAALPVTTRTEWTEVLVVGAGVAGLSTARALLRQGFTDVRVLDLEDRPGGNARSGRNALGAFPLGAHYLPVPDVSDVGLIELLQECGVITGFDDSGLPIYNEEHLCGDPHERLFHRGQWRSGLRPRSGLSLEEEKQFMRFEETVALLAERKGADGRWAFTIPLDNGSAAPDTADVRALDTLSFAIWLDEQRLTGDALRWYLDYCCLDDLGAPAAQVSAWAGLHYFAARRGHGANAEVGSVLTWPEGNDFLVQALLRPLGDKVRTGQLVRSVRQVGEEVQVVVQDLSTSEAVDVRCRNVVLAVPQFVAGRLLGDEHVHRSVGLQYAPWVVVNITLDRGPEERSGEAMAWDNVLFGEGSLGYVNACHQRLDRPPGLILTHYRALVGSTPKEARERAATVEAATWVEEAIAELERVHPDLRERIIEAEVAIWGHGMIVPTPGYIQGPLRARLAEPVADRIHFAHSDLSGISIFEEAFHHGLRAAREVLQQIRS
ncbi:MAG: FAD-dependent oxidoreductase [Flavobacteriales bacterium]|nr:FAD-dependent oxidoreductase [Flavobacteriales bacterium]